MRTDNRELALRGLLIGIALCSTHARAADAPPPSGTSPWHITVAPSFGAQGFKGNGSVGPLAGRMKLPFHKVAKDTRFAVAGSVTASRDDYGLWLDGQYLDMSHHLSVDGGQAHGQAKAYATVMSLGGYREVWHHLNGGRTVHGTAQQVSIAPLAGVRWTRLKATLDVADRSASQRETWAVPFAGVRVAADLSPAWMVSAESDLGAWGRTFEVQAQAFLGYRMNLLGYPAVARAGYQVLHQDYQGTGFHWNMTQYGPAVGLAVTF